MKKDVQFYEAEILDSIEKITEYIAGMTLSDFADDEKTFDACCMRLQHIGECGMKLASIVWQDYKDIPFQEMSGFRNRISHDYAGIDDEIVWNTIQISLKELEILLLGEEDKKSKTKAKILRDWKDPKNTVTAIHKSKQVLKKGSNKLKRRK